MELQSVNDVEAMENGAAPKVENLSNSSRNSSVLEKRIQKPLVVLFWQLIPFFRRVFLYFAIIALNNENFIQLPLILRAILKCAPLMTLTVFIFRQYNSIRELFRNKYGLLIFIGHLVAIAGAMIVVFDDDIEFLFLIGKALHVVAIILYTVAFGFFPFASRLFVRSLIAGCLGYYYLFIGAKEAGANFDLVMKIGSAVYIAVLLTMQWRAWARVSLQDLKQGRWFEFFGGMGSSFIVIAEAITLVDKLLKPPEATYYLLGADYSIEAFLYLGNFGIALSVLDGPNVIWPQERATQMQKSEPFRRSVLCLDKLPTNIRNFVLGVMDWIFS